MCGARCGEFLSSGKAGRSLQLLELFDEGGVVAFSLAGFSLDGFEDGAQAVEQLEEASDQRPVGDQFSIAEQAKQVFAGVGQRLEPFEAKESGGSLNCMYGAEDIAEKSSILGALLKIGEAALHAV